LNEIFLIGSTLVGSVPGRQLQHLITSSWSINWTCTYQQICTYKQAALNNVQLGN